MKLRFVLGEVWTGLRRNASMAISVALVTMISLLFLGIGMLTYKQVDLIRGYWYDKLQVSVVMCNATSGAATCAKGAATKTDLEQVRTQLEALPVVREVQYESQQQAYERFSEQFKGNPIVARTRPEQLKASYRVRLDDPGQYEIVASTFEGASGVERVDDQRKVIDPLVDLLRRLSLWSLGLAGVMLVCGILLVATTIRQAAFSRRRETGIMRLVGASAATIRTPFLLEAVLAALVGAGLAIGALWAVLRWLLDPAGGNPTIIGGVALVDEGDLLATTPVLLGTALVVSFVTAWIALWRHLRV